MSEQTKIQREEGESPFKCPKCGKLFDSLDVPGSQDECPDCEALLVPAMKPKGILFRRIERPKGL